MVARYSVSELSHQHFYEKVGYVKVGETEPDLGSGFLFVAL